MFGKKELKEDYRLARENVLRLESEKWELARDNAQLIRDKNDLEKSLDSHKEIISELKNGSNMLRNERDEAKKQNDLLVKALNKKFTKDELIEQLAELLLNENRGEEKDNLILQMNAALRINNTPPVHEGVVYPQ